MAVKYCTGRRVYGRGQGILESIFLLPRTPGPPILSCLKKKIAGDNLQYLFCGSFCQVVNGDGCVREAR